MSQKLCVSCQDLDLSIDKFIIHDGTFRRPKEASGSYGRRSDFPLKSGSKLFQLGTFQDIEAKKEDCPFCSLVAKSVGKPTEYMGQVLTSDDVVVSLKERKSICFFNWEIDGRDTGLTGRKARTRRIHLHWNNERVPDSYLVFVAPKRLFEFNSDSQGSWEREAFFLGRELRTDGNNQVLMKSWLDQCHQQHGPGCVGDHDDEFIQMATHSYFGVIDCLDMCLKSLPLLPGKSAKKKESRPTTPVDRYAGTSPSASSHGDDDEGESHITSSYCLLIEHRFRANL